MSKTSPTDPPVVVPPSVTPAALALWAQAEARKVARDLGGIGIPVLMLKGPDLQMRLYGTPAAYASSDVDVLVPRAFAEQARSALLRNGWEFGRDNGTLWRLSGAAAFDRDGFRLDLHWGLHAAHLPAWSLRSLERRLWSSASRGPSGMLEPDAESLLVFLAVHVAGHRFERPQWTENVKRAARLVRDWDRVRVIARECRVEGAVRRALSGEEPDTRVPLLDGAWGRAVEGLTWVGRGHFLSREARDAVKEAFALQRQGYGILGWSRISTASFAGREFLAPKGVFRPRAVSEPLVSLALDAVAGRSHPRVVEVGTGSGAIAISIAAERPDARVEGVDVSHRAVSWARRNQRRLGIDNVRFRQGSLLEPLPASTVGRCSVVVGNIPFIPPKDGPALAPVGPISTITGPSADGLDLVRELARQAIQTLEPGGRLVLQLADWQLQVLEIELEPLGYRLVEHLPGIPAFGVVEWRPQ
jgi:methylase of polypeptide subunit release factors